jgi:hypothetical protein
MGDVVKLDPARRRTPIEAAAAGVEQASVTKLVSGRVRRGKKIPKPVECKECGDPVETARVQALTTDAGLASGIMKPLRCWSCQHAWERRFERQMQGVRDFQAVEVID